MTKRDSSFAGITYPSSSMSKPRRLSWRSRGHGQSSSTAAPSDPLHPSRGDNAPQAGISLSPTGSGEYTPHYGYSSENLATPIPSPADHQAPILPTPTRESYPLQQEMEEVRRQLHAYYFVEVQSPSDDDTQPALRRLMVTEVDRRGHHHNRQPEYFFNGIIGHIRAGQNGWIDSWDQSSQLANYWRRYFQMPEISPYGNWRPRQHEAPGSPESLQESGMDDTDSLMPMLISIHLLSRSINWQRSSGTFSTMTGRPTWPYSNVLRILKETFPDTQFRSSRRQTWLILPATWRNLQGLCQTKHDAWRHYLMTACEF